MTPSPRDCDRRGFLRRTAALLGAGAAAACERGPLSPLADPGERLMSLHGGGTLHLYANESGLFAGREPFAVGLLLTDEPAVHDAALADLRESLGHFTELRYASTDGFKESYAEAALDHFFTADDLRFAAVVGDASRSAGGLEGADLYDALLDEVGGGEVVLHLEPRFLDPAPDAALESRLEARAGVEVEFLPAHESDLLQLGDLLTGSVRGDTARKAKGQSNPRGRAPRANVKERLIASLKRRLNVQRLAHPSMARRSGFNVRVLRPPF